MSLASNVQSARYAKVAVNVPVLPNSNEFYYYSIPEEIIDSVRIGTLVHVPFGNQELKGFVLDICPQEDLSSLSSNIGIKPIYEVIYKQPIWNERILKLAKWISEYYFVNIGTVLSASVGSDLLTHSTNEIELAMSFQDATKVTQEQKTILDKLLSSRGKSLSYKTLLQKTKLTRQIFFRSINLLKKRGIINSKIIYKEQSIKSDFFDQSLTNINSQSSILDSSLLALNEEQDVAYKTVLKTIGNQIFSKYLLYGVTGSGKTEVYFKLIEEVLKKNKSVIYLVPEIYLVSQIYQRLINRFDKSQIVLWHSSLSRNQRLDYWQSLQDSAFYEKPKIILGARSAILAPLENLGLVIVDEAHDQSYKQASPAPRYDAIKTAIKRAEIENCPIILGTATPNVSEYYDCLESNSILELKSRFQSVPMPEVVVVDLQNEYSKNNKNIISHLLRFNIEKALERKEQVILLLNRRGYSSSMFCRACGYVMYCDNCSVPLVYHKNIESMVCHHCGYQAGTLNNVATPCPKCKSPHFKYIGLGTQQLEEEVKKLFVNAKILRVDSDQLSRKDQYINLWNDFAEHKADILIGTQIVAKGIDLPSVTVVGVVFADSMLSFPDYISGERAFQLLTQVTGRAGRGQKLGKVFIQTYQPDNPIFKFIVNHDYRAFYECEVNQRKEFLYPPFTRLVRLIFQSENEQTCVEYADVVFKQLSAISNQIIVLNQVSFLGPAPCFFMKLQGKYRCHIICKFINDEQKRVLFNELFQTIKKNAKVDFIIDVDSVNLL